MLPPCSPAGACAAPEMLHCAGFGCRCHFPSWMALLLAFVDGCGTRDGPLLPRSSVLNLNFNFGYFGGGLSSVLRSMFFSHPAKLGSEATALLYRGRSIGIQEGGQRRPVPWSVPGTWYLVLTKFRSSLAEFNH
eukprot:SAG31_NODE_1707_length_7484_cov_8.798104_1_plen_134_part_00